MALYCQLCEESRQAPGWKQARCRQHVPAFQFQHLQVRMGNTEAQKGAPAALQQLLPLLPAAAAAHGPQPAALRRAPHSPGLQPPRAPQQQHPLQQQHEVCRSTTAMPLASRNTHLQPLLCMVTAVQFQAARQGCTGRGVGGLLFGPQPAPLDRLGPKPTHVQDQLRPSGRCDASTGMQSGSSGDVHTSYGEHVGMPTSAVQRPPCRSPCRLQHGLH